MWYRKKYTYPISLLLISTSDTMAVCICRLSQLPSFTLWEKLPNRDYTAKLYTVGEIRFIANTHTTYTEPTQEQRGGGGSSIYI